MKYVKFFLLHMLIKKLKNTETLPIFLVFLKTMILKDQNFKRIIFEDKNINFLNFVEKLANVF